jgi:putative transposase
MNTFQFFDPNQEIAVAYKNLPHWAQTGTLCFITWRTADSLPISVQNRITQWRAQLLRQFGLNSEANWKDELAKLSPNNRGRVQWSLFESWDEQLNRGAGRCLLAKPELSKIVADSLLHFDEERYVLTDFVIMPNHVHLLAAFATEDALLQQCTSWKRFTARQINAAIGESGEFWQVEQFDHLVRSEEQFAHLRRYIADNPKVARLPGKSFRHYSRKLTA